MAGADEDDNVARRDDPAGSASAVRGRGRFRKQVERDGVLAISPASRLARERLMRWISEGHVVLEAMHRILDDAARPEGLAAEATRERER